MRPYPVLCLAAVALAGCNEESPLAPAPAPPTSSITVHLTYPHRDRDPSPLAGFEIQAVSGPDTVRAWTDSTGTAAFVSLPYGPYAVAVAPRANDVSALGPADGDHLARLLVFFPQEHPAQWVVADTNRDGRVLTSDLLILVRWLRGMPADATHLGAWIFELPDMRFILEAPRTLWFSGVLVGDVDLSGPGSAPAPAAARLERPPLRPDSWS